MLICLNYATISENSPLLEQTEKLASDFSEQDLVLVDRLASGNGFSMLTGPLSTLYGKQAVYFFNPEDAAKIDRTRFQNIYLVIPEESWKLYKESSLASQLVFEKDYTISTEIFDTDAQKKDKIEKVSLLQLKSITTYGKIFRLK